jgi:HAD superfamily hydrolase (TIGR01509 family)
MTLPLPEGDFKAFLFDCDGTIADSMPLHYLAWDKALRESGCTSFTEDLFYAWGGWPVGDVVSELNRRDGLHIDVAPFAIRKEDIYYSLLDQLQVVPEVLEHIDANFGKIPFAVVSGSTRESVVKSLTHLGLLDRFDTLVCSGDYARGKPAPDPFLLAAERLGVPPAHCLVFEDAVAGIRSAEAAGMAWVKVPPPQPKQVAKMAVPNTRNTA